MNLGELSKILDQTAKSYISENGKLIKEIVPSLMGKPIDKKNIKKVINPFLDEIFNKVDKKVKNKLNWRLEEFIPEALSSITERNFHLHNADKTGLINPNNAIALIIMFVNHACMPLDHGLSIHNI